MMVGVVGTTLLRFLMVWKHKTMTFQPYFNIPSKEGTLFSFFRKKLTSFSPVEEYLFDISLTQPNLHEWPHNDILTCHNFQITFRA